MLWPCFGCQRHIKSSERACPFCGCHVEQPPPRLRYPHPSLSRAAKLAFFVTLAGASVANCAAPSPPPVQPVNTDVPPEESTPSDTSPSEEDAGSNETADAASSSIEEDASHHRVVLMYGSTEIHILEFVTFKPFSDQVPKSVDPMLDAVAEAIKAHTFQIEIEGYAGPTEKTKGLAKRRAQKVHDLLVARGVAKARMVVVDRMVTPDPDRPPPHPPSVRFHVVN